MLSISCLHWNLLNSNDSSDNDSQNQSKDQTNQAVGSPNLGNRSRPRGFSDSFASHGK